MKRLLAIPLLTITIFPYLVLGGTNSNAIQESTYLGDSAETVTDGGVVGRFIDNTYKLSASMINVQTNRVTGSGTSDDRAVLNSTIAVGGRTIYLPAGAYLIGTDKAISVPANTRIIGDGPTTIIRKISGTSDIFSIAADNVYIGNLRIEGPNNSNCDGIVIDNWATKVKIENVQGYRLASTVTAGLTATVYDIELDGVVSQTNTQQGIHMKDVNRGSVRRCRSYDIGSTNLHHGIYLSSVKNVTVSDFYASGCYGFGLHLYAQTTDNTYNVDLNDITSVGNGLSGSGATKGGIFIGSDGTAPANYIRGRNLSSIGDNVFGVAIMGNWSQIDIRGLHVNCVGVSTSTNGLYVESKVAGNRSLLLRNFLITGATDAGIRIYSKLRTIGSIDIDDGELISNTIGIYATGDVEASAIRLGKNIRNLKPPHSGLDWPLLLGIVAVL